MIMPSITRVGISLQEAPVHVGARVPLVGVADDVLVLGDRVPAELPFHPGREIPPPRPPRPDAMTSAMTSSGAHLEQDAGQGAIAVLRDVVLDALRVDMEIVVR